MMIRMVVQAWELSSLRKRLGEGSVISSQTGGTELRSWVSPPSREAADVGNEMTWTPWSHRIMERLCVKGTARNNLSCVGLILNCVSRVSYHQDREVMGVGTGCVVRVPGSRRFTLHPDTGKREQQNLAALLSLKSCFSLKSSEDSILLQVPNTSLWYLQMFPDTWAWREHFFFQRQIEPCLIRHWLWASHIM